MVSLPCRLRSLSMRMAMMYKAFSKSKKTVTRCSVLMNISKIKLSMWTNWSAVLLLLCG